MKRILVLATLLCLSPLAAATPAGSLETHQGCVGDPAIVAACGPNEHCHVFSYYVLGDRKACLD